MPEKLKNIEHLVFKFNHGTINSKELQVLTDWYNDHDDKKATIPLKTAATSEEISKRIWNGLKEKVAADEAPRPVKRLSVVYKLAAVAAIFVFAIGTWWALEYSLPSTEPSVVKTNIEPGGNKATLTLANGKTITLSNHQSGIIVGSQITYTNGLPVEYIPIESQNKLQEQVLRTPRGGNYNLTLPDGTQVSLNAESSIKYPSQFSAACRVVEIEGEVFFNVKSIYTTNGEKIPFKVIHKGQELEVLGTQFNINAYPGQAIKTTLVDGSVSIRNQQMHVTLKPNQQSINVAGKIKVREVDVTHFTAWREGKFSFDGKSFEETMDEIGRWYDLDITYANNIPKEELLMGDAFRNQNIDFVLRLLDVAEIDYSLDAKQRKLTIKGKKQIINLKNP